MSLEVTALITCLGAYLLGGIPMGVIIGRMRGVNILTIGSGNIGAANVGRALGFRWGALVFLLDVAKGLVATIAAARLLTSPAFGRELNNWTACCWLAVALCSVAGHNYSPFLGFRGGKGVATSFGAALGVFPHLTLPALIGFVAWGVVVATIRISSAGSMAGAIAFPAAYVLIGLWQGWQAAPRWPFVSFAVLATILVFVRHRANITRILQGTEAHLWERSARNSSDRKHRRETMPYHQK